MDIDAQVFGGLTNAEVFEWIKANCTFDQLIKENGTINEPDWIHVSLTRRRANRMQCLRMSNNKYYTI